MLSPVAKALARVRGGYRYGGSRLFDPSPLPCPACGLRIGADQRGAWGCAAGHRYPTTRSLIAALIATGWRPAFEVQIGSSAGHRNERGPASAGYEQAPA